MLNCGLDVSVTIYPLAGPYNLNLQSSSGFSHLRPEAFHIAFQTHKTQHTQPREWKKRGTSQHRLGLGAYSSEIPTQPSGTLTHPLTLANRASESTGPSSSLSNRLSLTVAFPRLLLTAFYC